MPVGNYSYLALSQMSTSLVQKISKETFKILETTNAVLEWFLVLISDFRVFFFFLRWSDAGC
jgi:hypothetical protein